VNAKKHWTDQAENFIGLAKCFKAAASCHSELSQKADAASYHKDLSDVYQKASECCANLGAGSVEYATGLPDVADESRTNADEQGPRGKSERDFLNLSGIAPDGVRFVFTKAASESAPAKRVLIPRHGSPDITTASVPDEFLDLVRLDT